MKLLLKYSICFILFFLAFFSCKKTEQVVIDDNVAPPDSTISNSIKEDYINKAYISLLGREPDSVEVTEAKWIINKNNLSLNDRKELLDTILQHKEYYTRLYQIARADLLN